MWRRSLRREALRLGRKLGSIESKIDSSRFWDFHDLPDAERRCEDDLDVSDGKADVYFGILGTAPAELLAKPDRPVLLP
jgi:hypothetical protein